MYDFFHQHSTSISFFLISSCILLFGCTGICYQWRRLRRYTETAQAEVFKIEERDTGEGLIYRSLARFRLEDDVYQVAGSWGPMKSSHCVGKEVTVYFPPGHPELALVSRLHKLLPYVTVCLFGTAVLYMTIYLTLNLWIRQATPKQHCLHLSQQIRLPPPLRQSLNGIPQHGAGHLLVMLL